MNPLISDLVPSASLFLLLLVCRVIQAQRSNLIFDGLTITDFNANGHKAEND